MVFKDIENQILQKNGNNPNLFQKQIATNNKQANKKSIVIFKKSSTI